MSYSRETLTNKRDECLRKKACYEEKIVRNSNLKSAIETGLTNCISYANQMSYAKDDAYIFSELYELNSEIFNQELLTDILNSLDELGKHLEAIKQQASTDADYWQGKLNTHNANVRKKEQNERVNKEILKTFRGA